MAVACTRVLRRGDDIRETLGVQACGPNLRDPSSRWRKIGRKTGKALPNPQMRTQIRQARRLTQN